MQQQTFVHDTTPQSAPRTARQIEDRLDADRRDLTASLTALRDRLSVDALWADGMSLARANVQPYTRAVDAAVRANPAAVALTGIGLAWLILGRRGRPKAGSAIPPGSLHAAVQRWEDEGGPVAATNEPHEERWGDDAMNDDWVNEDWVKEAAKRGLSNIKNMPRAIEAYLSKESVQLFERHGVLSHKELEARNEIRLETYIKKVQIEARVIGDLAMNHIIPTAIAYQNKLIQNANGLKGLGVDNKAVVQTIKEISGHIDTIKNGVRQMIEERKRINKITDTHKRSFAYCDDVKEKYFDEIRDAVDKLELLVDDEDWPLVKYREMLFLR